MVIFDFAAARRDAVRAVWEVRRAVINRHRSENITALSLAAAGPPQRPPATEGEVLARLRSEILALGRSGTSSGSGGGKNSGALGRNAGGKPGALDARDALALDGAGSDDVDDNNVFDAYNVRHFPVPMHPLTRLVAPPGRGQIVLSSEALARLTEVSMAIDSRYARIDPSMRRDILRAAVEHVMGVEYVRLVFCFYYLFLVFGFGFWFLVCFLLCFFPRTLTDL
jgi:hypothetical protein